jgi:hypothetical protein
MAKVSADPSSERPFVLAAELGSAPDASLRSAQVIGA